MIKRLCDRAGCKNEVNSDEPKVMSVFIAPEKEENPIGKKLDLCDECMELFDYMYSDPKAMAMVFKGLKVRRTKVGK